MKIENIEFGEALRNLAKKAGITLKSYQSGESGEIKEKIYEINHLASEFYHYLLLNRDFAKPALSYLEKRGIKKNTLELFKIGFAPDMWQSVSKFLVGKKKYPPYDLELAGLTIQGRDYYDRFRNRLIFPLIDQRDNVVGFSGRLLDPDIKEAKYINSPETLVYIKSNHLFGINLAKDSIKKENKAILVEGEFDMISSYQAGVKNVVAIKGSALTDGQVNLLKRYTENLIFALDADFAGNNASFRGIEIADKAGFNMRVVDLLYGKDPDECIKKDPSLWLQSLKNALPVYDYFLNFYKNKFDPNSPEGKKKIAGIILPFFAKINNEIVKSHYIKKIAVLLSVSEESIIREINKIGRFGYSPPAISSPSSASPKSRQELLEEKVLSLLLQSTDQKNSLLKIREILKPSDFQIVVFQKIYSHLEKQEPFPPEFTPSLDKLFLMENEFEEATEEKRILELEKTALALLELSLKRQIKETAGNLEKAETENNIEQIKSLSYKLKLLSEKLKNLQQI